MPKKSRDIGRRDDAPKKIKGTTVKAFCISLAAAVVVAAAGSYAYVSYQDSKTRERDADFVSEQKAAQTAVVNSVDSVLGAGTGVARVYDSSDHLLFSLRYGNGVEGVASVPEPLYSDLIAKLTDNTPVSKISIEDWSYAHTILGGILGSKSEEELRAGSLGWKAVEYFCDETQTMLSDNSKFVIAAYLDQEYTTEELVAYCASVGSFGGITGVMAASEQWFNKAPDKLNDNQLAYMGYAFGNNTASWEGFKENHSDKTGGAETAEDFGFWHVGGDPYWLLKEKVSEELSRIVGDRLLTEDFSVKLQIDSTLQSTLQEALDEGLRTSITLGADGQTVLDGTVGVVNPKNGFVVALVGGRSVNTVSRSFKLDCTSLIGNYKAAGDAMKEDPTLTYATLKPIETAAGTTDYVPFGSLITYDQLGTIGISPEVESTSTLDEVLSFGNSLYLSVEPRYISEVKDTSGTAVYTATAGTDVSDQAPNPDLRALISGTYEGNNCQYVLDCESGTVFGEFSSEFVLGALVGSNTTGYAMQYEDYDLSATTVLSIKQIVEGYYQREPELIDPAGVVKSKVEAAQQSNAAGVREAVDSWVEELSDMEINSIGTRSQFEQLYAQYIDQLHGYMGLISDSLLSELHAKLDAVRADRAEELLQYAA